MNTIEWHQEQLQKRKRSEALDKIVLKRTQEIIKDLQKSPNYKCDIKNKTSLKDN